MNQLQRLYNRLVRDGKYTKSFEEFQKQFSNAGYQKRVFDSITKDGLYTKGWSNFKDQYKVPEKQEDVNWFNQTWFGRGFKAASTTGEATDLMMSDFSNIDINEVQAFMDAKKEEAATSSPSERMQKFQKQYIKEGKTWSAFFRGVRKNPGLLPELFVQSLGTQIGTAFDAPESLGTAAAGAAIGGFAAGPVGFFAGGMGGLATSMEAALTFGELIEKELAKQGKEFTDENIKELLEGPMGKKIRSRSLGRGLAIGAIEGFSGGLAGKTAVATTKAVAGASKAARIIAPTAAAVGVEAIGGGTGEVAGRLAAAQEMDPAEIGFEAVTGTTTAPINVAVALATHKKPTYHINDPKKNEPLTRAQIKKIIDESDAIDVAKMDINVKNDPILERGNIRKKETRYI
jgi:hypothetical protein